MCSSVAMRGLTLALAFDALIVRARAFQCSGGTISSPTDGSVTITSESSATTSWSTATFACLPGYDLDGGDTLQCPSGGADATADSEWSSTTAPSCKPQQCYWPTDSAFGALAYHVESHGGSCDVGMELSKAECVVAIANAALTFPLVGTEPRVVNVTAAAWRDVPRGCSVTLNVISGAGVELIARYQANYTANHTRHAEIKAVSAGKLAGDSANFSIDGVVLPTECGRGVCVVALEWTTLKIIKWKSFDVASSTGDQHLLQLATFIQSTAEGNMVLVAIRDNAKYFDANTKKSRCDAKCSDEIRDAFASIGATA